MAETLRRAGTPVVSSSGPVIAMPDEWATGDVPVYAEFIAVLTTSVRAGDRYTISQYVETLAGLGLPIEGLSFATVAGILGDWGKVPDSPSVIASAAATVRALAAHRGQVLYPGADEDPTYLDPLQYTILVAHSVGTVVGVKPEAKAHHAQGLSIVDRLLGTGVAYAVPGPCSALTDLLKTDSAVTRGNVDFLKDQLKDRILGAVLKEGTKEALDKVTEAASKAGAVISSALLMLGSRLDLTPSKESTHFKHTAGSVAEHVTLTAKATFDLKVAADKRRR